MTDGAAFENPMIMVIVSGQGCVTRCDVFDVDDLDAALRHFEQLRT
jgi:hypothetical protein